MVHSLVQTMSCICDDCMNTGRWVWQEMSRVRDVIVGPMSRLHAREKVRVFTGTLWALTTRPAKHATRRAYAGMVSATSHALHRPTTVYVDSMALRFITASCDALLRVTDAAPTVKIETVSGAVPVTQIGVIGLNVADRVGRWHHFEIPDAHVTPQTSVELYPVQVAFRTLGIRHFFDDVNELCLPDGTRIPFGSNSDGYPLEVIYGPPLPGAVIHAPQNRRAMAATLPSSLALVWRRLAFPYEQQWKQTLHALDGAFPADVTRQNALPKVDRFVEPAILRGRLRALPLFTGTHTKQGEPGDRVYMDGCGPFIPGVGQRYTNYIGCVCASSGYARILPCHGQDQASSAATLAIFIADLRAKMGMQRFLAPLVVRSDNGSAFVAHSFREFCSRNQMMHTTSSPYVPQQNSFAERLWGTRFATARVLLAVSNLSSRFHVQAILCANWIHNRLPQPSRDGLTPFQAVTGSRPDMTHLHCFGCATAVFRSAAERSKAKHEHKLVADHASFGVYLGPSETTPGHVVYIPRSNKIVVSPHCVFREDTFPGTKNHIQTNWDSILSDAIRDAPDADPDRSQRRPDWATAIATVMPTAAIATGPAAEYVVPPDMSDVDSAIPREHAIVLPTDATATHETSATSTEGASVDPSLRDAAKEGVAARPGDPEPTTHPDTLTEGEDKNTPPPVESTSPPPKMGVDGRAKRQTPQRAGNFHYADSTDFVSVSGVLHQRKPPAKYQPASSLPHAFAALTGAKCTPARLASYMAPLMHPRPIFAYLACVAAAALPQPDFDMEDCRIPKGYSQALKSIHAEYWVDAIEREWTGIMANDSLDFVTRHSMPSGANLMHSHFVFDIKPRPDGSIEKFKARLVADGNTQKHGVDFDAVFATVVKISSIRIVLVLAAMHNWGLWQLDVKQAFLQADLQEPLYMRMPPHLSDRNGDGAQLVCRLKKSLYGLKQAAREWASVLTQRLLEYGFIQSSIDTCVYRHNGNGPDDLLICLVYVDDLILAYASEHARKRFVDYITGCLPIDDRGQLQWVLRMEISRPKGEKAIVLSQQQYALKLAARYHPEYAEGPRFDSPMDETIDLVAAPSPEPSSSEHAVMATKRAAYMSAVGALLWLAAGTRPDITHSVSTLARFCSNPGDVHYRALQRCISYVGQTASHVLRLAPDAAHHLQVYSDASWAAQHSISGGVILYMGCPISWWSRRQRSVSSSTAQAEYFAASLASREGVYARDFVADIGYSATAPTPLLLDSKAAIDLAEDPVAFKKTKHIMRAAYELRERVAHDVYKTVFVPSENQLADILTKSLRPGDHARLLPQLLYAEPCAPTRIVAASARVASVCRRPRINFFWIILITLMAWADCMPPSPPERPEPAPHGDAHAPPLLVLPPPIDAMHAPNDAHPPSDDNAPSDVEQRPNTPDIPRCLAPLAASGDPRKPLPCSPHDWRECQVCQGTRCARCLVDTEDVNTWHASCKCDPDDFIPGSPGTRPYPLPEARLPLLSKRARPSSRGAYPNNPCPSRWALRGRHEMRNCPICDKTRCYLCLRVGARSKVPQNCTCPPNDFRLHYPLEPRPDEDCVGLPPVPAPPPEIPALTDDALSGVSGPAVFEHLPCEHLPVGSHIIVNGLTRHTELNGALATVLAFEPPTAGARPRYRILLSTTNTQVYLKPRHVFLAPPDLDSDTRPYE